MLFSLALEKNSLALEKIFSCARENKIERFDFSKNNVRKNEEAARRKKRRNFFVIKKNIFSRHINDYKKQALTS